MSSTDYETEIRENHEQPILNHETVFRQIGFWNSFVMVRKEYTGGVQSKVEKLLYKLGFKNREIQKFKSLKSKLAVCEWEIQI